MKPHACDNRAQAEEARYRRALADQQDQGADAADRWRAWCVFCGEEKATATYGEAVDWTIRHADACADCSTAILLRGERAQ